MDLDAIKAKVQADAYVYTQHAEIERRLDNLTFAEIEQALLVGEILEDIQILAVGRAALLLVLPKRSLFISFVGGVERK